MTGEKIKVPDTQPLDRHIRKGKRKLARAMKGSKRREWLRIAMARRSANAARPSPRRQPKAGTGSPISYRLENNQVSLKTLRQ